MCWLVFHLLYTSIWIIISLQLTSFCNLRISALISSMTVMFLIVKINKVVGAEKMVYCSIKSVMWCSKMCKIVFGRGCFFGFVSLAVQRLPNFFNSHIFSAAFSSAAFSTAALHQRPLNTQHRIYMRPQKLITTACETVHSMHIHS